MEKEKTEQVEETVMDTVNIDGQEYTKDQIMEYGTKLIQKSNTEQGITDLYNTFKTAYDGLNPQAAPAPKTEMKEMTGDTQADMLILADQMKEIMSQNMATNQAIQNVSQEMKGYANTMQNTNTRQSTAEKSAEVVSAELNIQVTPGQLVAYMNETGLSAKEAVFAKRGNDIIKANSGNREAPKMMGTGSGHKSLDIDSDKKLTPKEMNHMRETNPEELDRYLDARMDKKGNSGKIHNARN